MSIIPTFFFYVKSLPASRRPMNDTIRYTYFIMNNSPPYPRLKVCALGLDRLHPRHIFSPNRFSFLREAWNLLDVDPNVGGSHRQGKGVGKAKVGWREKGSLGLKWLKPSFYFPSPRLIQNLQGWKISLSAGHAWLFRYQTVDDESWEEIRTVPGTDGWGLENRVYETNARTKNDGGIEGWGKRERWDSMPLTISDELRTRKAGGKRGGGVGTKRGGSFTSLKKKIAWNKVFLLFFKSIVSSYIFRHDSLTCFWEKKKVHATADTPSGFFE